MNTPFSDPEQDPPTRILVGVSTLIDIQNGRDVPRKVISEHKVSVDCSRTDQEPGRCLRWQ